MWPLAAAVLLIPLAAFADTDQVDARTVWSSWDLSLSIVIPTLLGLGIYVAGLARRPGALDAHPWRCMAFIWGVLITFLSLASPIDGLSDHLFFMHQVQHMLIREVGPMLIALSQPQALLIAGLPAPLRRWAMAPVAGSGAVRGAFGFLTRPGTVTVVFVGSLYLWQWPWLHDVAILHEDVHYVMHVTMLAAGLLFFWRVFDQRPAPKGTRFGVRLMMLWIAVLSNIPIGAYITFKHQELYPAYDIVGRLFPISPIDDEGLGGFIMWAPCSMMMLLAVLVVIHRWARDEEKIEGRRLAAAHAPAMTAEMIVEQARPKNRALAWGLAAFAACMLAATVSVGVLALHQQASNRAARLVALGASPIAGQSPRSTTAMFLPSPAANTSER